MMKPSQSTLMVTLGALLVIASFDMKVPLAAAQNCSLPPESHESSTVIVELDLGKSETHYRVLHSPFQGAATAENLNITGIITRGSGTETLDVTLADDVRGGLDTTDVYMALLWQIFPFNAEPQTETGPDINFPVPIDDSVGVFLLLTVDPTPTASFPACYTETLTLREPDTTPPHLIAVTHTDNLEGPDSIILDFDEPLGTFNLMSLAIGAVDDCQILNTRDSFIPGDQTVTLTITPGRFRRPEACDLATLEAGNTLQLDAITTSDLVGNPLSESNDSASYPGSGEIWEVEGSEALPSEAAALSIDEEEQYVPALRALITSLQHKLRSDNRLQAKLRHVLTTQQQGPTRHAEELLEALLQSLRNDFQHLLQ
jgi:hypothetical protein